MNNVIRQHCTWLSWSCIVVNVGCIWFTYMATIHYIVVTYFQFDSNIRILYVFLGFLKNIWKYLKILDHRCLWVWAQLKLSLLSILLIVFTYFTYSHFQILKYLKILLFEHLRKIRVFRMSLLWSIRAYECMSLYEQCMSIVHLYNHSTEHKT
jgi:hypothetical protein